MTTAAAEHERQQWIPGPDSVVLGDRPVRPDTNLAALSRYRDARWDLSPAVFAPHHGACSITFDPVYPTFRAALKHVCWLMINYDGPAVTPLRPSAPRPAVLTVVCDWPYLRAFVNWLASQGRRRLGEVTPQDLDDYLDAVRDGGYTREQQMALLGAVQKIWIYQTLLDEQDRLPEPPLWSGDRFHHLLEGARSYELMTPRIAPDIMDPLLAWSLRFIEDLAGDITEAAREGRRMTARDRRGVGRNQPCTGSDAIPELRKLVRAFSRLNIALPVTPSPSTGALGYNYPYLMRLMNLRAQDFTPSAWDDVLDASGLAVREARPLLLLPAGTINGELWRDHPINVDEVRPLARHLSAACFVVIAYLSGMRPGEVLSLERGCIHRDPGSGILLLTGRHWKNARDDTGALVAQGQIRPDPWVVAEPVATAVAVLERLHDEPLLFPNRLDPPPWPAKVRNRRGKARTSSKISQDLNEFRDWVNDYCRQHRRDDAIPIDSDHPALQPRQFRRTLAWFIARKPRGLVAAAIQYGHLRIQMTIGYAGTYASGFPDDLTFEELLATLDALAQAHEHLEDGEHVSGPSATEYRHRVAGAQRFAGRVSLTRRDARQLDANPDLQIYPGEGMTCVFNPQRAACRTHRNDTDTRRTPDLSDCRPQCANVAHTDRDVAVLVEQARHLETILTDPLAPAPRAARDRGELARLRAIIGQHDAARTAHDG